MPMATTSNRAGRGCAGCCPPKHTRWRARCCVRRRRQRPVSGHLVWRSQPSEATGWAATDPLAPLAGVLLIRAWGCGPATGPSLRRPRVLCGKPGAPRRSAASRRRSSTPAPAPIRSRSRPRRHGRRFLPGSPASRLHSGAAAQVLTHRAVPRMRRRAGGHQVTHPCQSGQGRALAPSAMPSRMISARPRVRIAAAVFSPRPTPTAIPDAKAMTFLQAPPTSVPTTSLLVYGRKYPLFSMRCSATARPESLHATTVAAG